MGCGTDWHGDGEGFSTQGWGGGANDLKRDKLVDWGKFDEVILESRWIGTYAVAVVAAVLNERSRVIWMISLIGLINSIECHLLGAGGGWGWGEGTDQLIIGTGAGGGGGAENLKRNW